MTTDNNKLEITLTKPTPVDKNIIITIFSLNTRNLKSIIDDITNDYDLLEFDILCLQETHIPKIDNVEKFK